MQNTERFSGRVGDYAQSRPGYPAETITLLEHETGLSTSAIIADIGSGTGISSEMFLQYGCRVFGVEPNDEMRRAGEVTLQDYQEFTTVRGSAEATGLDDHSVDYVVAARAGHWFDVEMCRKEFARILRGDGWIVLMWNLRRLDTTPFLRAFEALLQQFGTDYGYVKQHTAEESRIRRLFANDEFIHRALSNAQHHDRDGFIGRIRSMSYTPAPDQPGFAVLMDAADRIYHEHQQDGIVTIEYDTEIYWGRPVSMRGSPRSRTSSQR